jgi:hypothetical protein
MKDSSTSIRAFANSNNVATPHARVEEKVKPVAWRNIDNIAPAGSINSNVVDMAQWLRLNLGGGVYQDKRLLSTGAMKEMQSPQTVIRLEGPMERLYPNAHFLNYGLGWFLSDYRGRKLVEHGGAIDGMRSAVAMIPEEKLGVVILTNLNGSILPQALAYKVFDLYLGAPNKDWTAELLKTTKALEEQAKTAEKKAEDERVKGTSPSLSVDRYAGSYQSEMYGDAKIEVDNGKLVARFGPNFNGDLEHWHYDTFRVKWRDPMQGKGFISFRLNSQGKIDGLSIEGLSDFTRKADAAAPAAAMTLSEADLRKYVGKYVLEGAGIEIAIEMVGNSLKATVPSQPVYTLVPVSADRFRLEGAPDGFFAQFEMSEGKPKSLTLIQGSRASVVLKPKA